VHRGAPVGRRHRLVRSLELHVCCRPRRAEAKAVSRCGRRAATALWRARYCRLAIPAFGTLRAFLRGCRRIHVCADVREVG
jgi:hypothetical protein